MAVDPVRPQDDRIGDQRTIQHSHDKSTPVIEHRRRSIGFFTATSTEGIISICAGNSTRLLADQIFRLSYAQCSSA